MGYGFICAKTKKDINEDKEILFFECQYNYQQYFKKAFGEEITNYSGRITKSNIDEYINGIDNFINILEKGVDVPMYRGYIGNCSQNNLIKYFKELKDLIEEGKVKYIMIG